MRIRLTIARDGRQAGDVIEVPAAEGRAMIRAGHAVLARWQAVTEHATPRNNAVEVRRA